MRSIIKYFWLFVFGSFFGYIIETLWCLIKTRKLESRKGLIYGHLTPIYGIAGMLLTIVLDIFEIQHYFVIFFLTFLISFIVEYVASLFQEKCFGTVSWDYSDFPLNLNGRVNLIYMIAFSIFGLIWIKIYPVFLNSFMPFLDKYNLINLVTFIGFNFMIYNIFISCAANYRQKLRRNGKTACNKFDKWLDVKYNDEYLKKVYTNAIVVDKRKKVFVKR